MNRLVRARFLVAASFLLATLTQGYALFVQNDPPSAVAYFPSPYFLVSFFVMETSLQFYWIMQLFGRGLREARTPLPPREDSGWLEVQETNTVEPAQMAFVSLYAISNFFLVGSIFAWHFGQFAVSQIWMAFSTACQLYFIFFVLHPAGTHARTPQNRLTHLVVKTSAGIVLLYMWRAWGVMEIGPFRPDIQQQVHCGVLVLLLAFASGPDPTLGICLLLNLAAFVAGDTKDDWKFAFSCIMGVLTVVLIFDFILNRRAPQISVVRDDDSEDEESALPCSEDIFLADLTPEGSPRV
ncbi:hypothetical protein DFH08DRAFT_1032599 [Mycena albidolilacea]|uniref:Transmembrane protein n=1 Tax=Mycena albidolilacea TaxID=1033008 RepID=A0AAD7ALP2_9AGAR|nr:hypothetical protein DFH08DRAFT_1032599 [Mycena albidolilacea]